MNAEITGVTMTPDYKAIFINVQHPGEDCKELRCAIAATGLNQTNTNVKTARPRSAPAVITRKDGRVIARINLINQKNADTSSAFFYASMFNCCCTIFPFCSPYCVFSNHVNCCACIRKKLEQRVPYSGL